MITTQQKEDLGLKGIAFTITVKIGKERVLFKDFQNDLGIECGLEKAGKSGLTDSDNPFDGNVHEQAPKVMFTKDTIR
jgi:hypothetical protein